MRRHWFIGGLASVGLVAGWVLAPQGAAPLYADGAAPATQPATTQAADDFNVIREKGSYALGVNIGMNIKQGGIEVDVEAMAKGLRDGFSGQKPNMSPQEMDAVLQAFQEATMKIKQAAGEKNLAAGKAFMEANKSKDGVKTLPSGVQYRVLKSGSGASPRSTDKVKTNYKGTLIDGTEFDSSAAHGGPAVFGLRQVIQGWTEALQQMKVGDKWELVVPPNLAYGFDGQGAKIGPNATLIFEVELLEINPKP